MPFPVFCYITLMQPNESMPIKYAYITTEIKDGLFKITQQGMCSRLRLTPADPHTTERTTIVQ